MTDEIELTQEEILDTMTVCAACMYFEPIDTDDEKDVGECRRYPRQFVKEDRAIRTFFPLVSYSDWCGEFHPSRAVQN